MACVLNALNGVGAISFPSVPDRRVKRTTERPKPRVYMVCARAERRRAHLQEMSDGDRSAW